MELALIACSHTLREDLENFFKENAIEGYTILPMAIGAGEGGGKRLDSVIWPGHNVLIFVGVEPQKYDLLKTWVQNYRKQEMREGIKLFNLALKDVI